MQWRTDPGADAKEGQLLGSVSVRGATYAVRLDRKIGGEGEHDLYSCALVSPAGECVRETPELALVRWGGVGRASIKVQIDGWGSAVVINVVRVEPSERLLVATIVAYAAVVMGGCWLHFGLGARDLDDLKFPDLSFIIRDLPAVFLSGAGVLAILRARLESRWLLSDWLYGAVSAAAALVVLCMVLPSYLLWARLYNATGLTVEGGSGGGAPLAPYQSRLVTGRSTIKDAVVKNVLLCEWDGGAGCRCPHEDWTLARLFGARVECIGCVPTEADPGVVVGPAVDCDAGPCQLRRKADCSLEQPRMKVDARRFLRFDGGADGTIDLSLTGREPRIDTIDAGVALLDLETGAAPGADAEVGWSATPAVAETMTAITWKHASRRPRRCGCPPGAVACRCRCTWRSEECRAER
ncbi:MAG: hypothetical protein JOZ69_22905 [Myxococcales bacterium]|nr:hypothetical protein [Myxococcales bacterium]